MNYLLVSLVITLSSFLLFSRLSASMNLTKINMISWMFYFSLLMQSVISSVIVVNFWEDHYRISNQLIDPDSRYYGWLSIQWVMIGMPLGVVVSNTLFGYKSGKKLFLKYIQSPVVDFDSRDNNLLFMLLIVLSVISLLAVAYTFWEIGYFPQKLLFGVSNLGAGEVRNEVGREFSGNSIVRNIFALTLTPVLSYIWFAYYKKDSRFKYFFLAFLLASLLIVTYNLAKAPLLLYLMGFVFINVYINGGVSFKKIFLLSLVALVIIVALYYLTHDSIDILHLFSLNSGIGGRILLGQSMGVYFSFDIIPLLHEHIYFSSLSGFINNFLGIEHSERSARVLMGVLNPAGVRDGTAGVMNSLFIAEAWGNFGIFGVFISPIVIGFYVQTLFMFFITSKKTPIYLGLFAFFSYKLPIVGGFNDFIYNPINFVVFMIFMMMMVLSSKGKLM